MAAHHIKCIDCRAASPNVETEYTLISNRFGWRLTRKAAADGTVTLEWRCPTCWAKFKSPAGATGAAPPPTSSRRSRS